MIPNRPKSLIMCVATIVFVGVISDHQWSSDTHMIIHHHVNSTTVTMINTHRYKLQIHLFNLPPLCHVTTAWITHTASYKLHLCY